MNSIVLRSAIPPDHHFIMNSWLTSHSENRLLSPMISTDLYFQLHRPIVENILQRPTTFIIVAVNDEDPTLIYGYAVFEVVGDARVFHYIYVKRAFKGFGIMRKLIEAAPFPMEHVYITHVTRAKYLFTKYDFTYCFYFLYPVKLIQDEAPGI